MKQKDAVLLTAVLAVCLLFSSCAGGHGETESEERDADAPDTKNYLSLALREPETVDPQCTDDGYLIAINVLDRLVETRAGEDGADRIEPSLADSWEISEDHLTYTFHLRKGVRFSNGSPLTASDVRYTLTRLLTDPYSCHQEIASCIAGAEALRDGTAKTLAGIDVKNDYELSITLSAPCAPFLANLSTPAASILDEESVSGVGSLFGRTARHTVGTGPFIVSSWEAGEEMVLTANPDCWSGAPRCDGILIRFVPDADQRSLLFQGGQLDVLDLEELGSEAEYYIRGDIYRDRLYRAPRVSISFIALNESVKPLDDVRVRRALQFALDRQMLLTATLGGRGAVENGIFPHGLLGYDATLPEIRYDREAARALLCEAGYENGFDLLISVPETAGASRLELATLVASMWQKIGVRARVMTLSASAFSDRRKGGNLACYCARWTADCDDPDNFMYTFFGSAENSRSYSLCYSNEAIMSRVRAAREIWNENARLREYRALEKRIVQEDAAWIPLFSQQHYFMVSDRVDGFRISWNGSADNRYCEVSVQD